MAPCQPCCQERRTTPETIANPEVQFEMRLRAISSATAAHPTPNSTRPCTVMRPSFPLGHAPARFPSAGALEIPRPARIPPGAPRSAAATHPAEGVPVSLLLAAWAGASSACSSLALVPPVFFRRNRALGLGERHDSLPGPRPDG